MNISLAYSDYFYKHRVFKAIFLIIQYYTLINVNHEFTNKSVGNYLGTNLRRH
jgi:hypothetical protein